SIQDTRRPSNSFVPKNTAERSTGSTASAWGTSLPFSQILSSFIAAPLWGSAPPSRIASSQVQRRLTSIDEGPNLPPVASYQHRGELRAIARRAMIERGLEPDFSPAVLAETGAITRPADDRDPAIHDLRHLLWASIDNDDSRDLDQLSVAEPAGGDAMKILVAVADVDAVVRKGSAIDGHARTNTTSVYTAADVFP